MKNAQFKLPDYLIEELKQHEQHVTSGSNYIPSPQLVAGFVKAQRAVRNWKQATLAAIAGVSLSTIERIERAETVAADSLDRVSLAFGLQAGDLTRPRPSLTTTQIAEGLERTLAHFANMTPIAVRPLTTQPQIISLARCEYYFLDASRIGEAYNADMDNLRDWLDIAAEMLAKPNDQNVSDGGIRRRDLYKRILNTTQEIERRAYAVALAGTYTARTGTEDKPNVEVAVLTFAPKFNDPSAAKRRAIWVPQRVDMNLVWQAFCERV